MNIQEIVGLIVKEKWLLHLFVGVIALILGRKYDLLILSFFALLSIELFKEYLDTLNMGRWCPDRSIPDIIATMLPHTVYMNLSIFKSNPNGTQKKQQVPDSTSTK